MKTFLYFIKIFFLILFNSILDLSIAIGIKIKTVTLFFERNLKKLLVKIGHFFNVLLNKIKEKYPIIKEKIKNKREIICFVISDYYINLRYKLFIWKCIRQKKKAEQKKLKEASLERERFEREKRKQEKLIVKQIKKEQLEKKRLEKLEQERIEKEKLEQEKCEKEKITEQSIVEEEKEKQTKSISTSKSIFILLFWFLIVGIALICIILAENTFLGIDLNRQFLYNVNLLTREQAKILIFIGMFFSLIATGELLVFLYKFITCKPMLNTFKPSHFTLALMFSYFSGTCFVLKDELRTSIDNELIQSTYRIILLDKALPIIAIIFFLIGAIELIISFSEISLKEESNNK